MLNRKTYILLLILIIMITKEKFNQLGQLDRIEYRQKREIILNYFQSNLFGMTLAFLIGFFIVGSLFLGLCFGGERMMDFMFQFKANLTLWGLLLLFSIVGDVFILKKKIDSIKKLEEEFFEIEIKIKERENGKRKKRK